MGATTAKWGIDYPVGTDATNVPGDIENPMNQIDSLLSPWFSGTLAALPVAGKFGRQYLCTDGANYGLTFFDTGSTWLATGFLNDGAVGSAGLVSTITPGASSAQGGSGFGADASHQHAAPPWGADNAVKPLGSTNSNGTANAFARVDHQHEGGAVGDVRWSFGAGPFANEVIANGQVLSQATYPTLYGIAVAQGWAQNSPGSGNFNVIDLRDRTPVGAGNNYSVGQLAGSASTSLTVGNLPAHTHSGTTSGESATHYHTPTLSYAFVIGDLPHSVFWLNHGADIDHGNSGNITYSYPTDVPSVNHNHPFTTDGGQGTNGTPLSVVQPVVGMTPYIRAL